MPQTMPEIIIYQYEISPFSDKVRRALKLKGLEYKIGEVLPTKAKKWKHISPTGKFPAMQYDDNIIVDSTDIINYLEEKHPDPALIPSDPKNRAWAHILEDWSDESLYFYDLAIRSKENNSKLLADDISRHESDLNKKILGLLIPKAISKNAHVQGLGRKDSTTLDQEIRKHFSALETLLTDQEFLCGPEISSADLAVVSMLHVLIRAEEPAAALPNYSRLQEWKAKVDELTL